MKQILILLAVLHLAPLAALYAAETSANNFGDNTRPNVLWFVVDDMKNADRAEMNQILLALPAKRRHTACVDARDLKTALGDDVHYAAAAQDEIGKRYAAKMSELLTK